VQQLLSGVADERALVVTKISNSNTINRKDLWAPLVFLSLSFKFVFAVLNNYHFLSSRCIVGPGLAGITCFYQEVYPRQGGGGKFIPGKSH
jgi:hypothetical protein